MYSTSRVTTTSSRNNSTPSAQSPSIPQSKTVIVYPGNDRNTVAVMQATIGFALSVLYLTSIFLQDPYLMEAKSAGTIYINKIMLLFFF